MKISLKTILILFSFLCYFSVHAQPVIILNDPQKIVNGARHCQVLEDPGGVIDLADISKYSSKFKDNDRPYFNFGITKTVFWIKFELLNKGGTPLYLEVGNPSLDTVQVFEIDKNKKLIAHYSGNYLAYKSREVRDINYLFLLNTKKDSLHTVYLRVMHSRGTQFPLMIGTLKGFYQKSSNSNLFSGIYYGFILAMIFYNLFIFFSLKDRAYIYYVSYISFMGVLNASLIGHGFKYLWPNHPFFNNYVDSIAIMVGLSGILFVMNFLDTRNNTPRFHKVFIVLIILYLLNFIPLLQGNTYLGTIMVEMISLLVILLFFICAFVALRMNYVPARFFLIAWSFLLLSVVIFIMKDFVFIPYRPITASSLQIGSAIEALVLSMALANRINIYKEEKIKAQNEAYEALNEKKKLITEQNVTLERQVAMRTSEIKEKHDELVDALDNLKQTQAQLIQREKMASLGELTSGIAHEIQNPLNFVNNFSDVSVEIIDELIEVNDQQNEIDKKVSIELLENLKHNISIINDHGRRADSIVKSMLQHSQPNKGEFEACDINDLIEEYLRLSYIGYKAKNINFNAKLTTQLDPSIGEANLVPQDLARVFVNLFNNSFYALNEKCKKEVAGYEPELSVSSKLVDSAIELQIRDNGTGISPAVINKIFQPFFTTKPSGTGTGLGLSLSYDIIAKEHSGLLDVKSQEGEFTLFTITLPMNHLKVPDTN